MLKIGSQLFSEIAYSPKAQAAALTVAVLIFAAMKICNPSKPQALAEKNMTPLSIPSKEPSKEDPLSEKIEQPLSRTSSCSNLSGSNDEITTQETASTASNKTPDRNALKGSFLSILGRDTYNSFQDSIEHLNPEIKNIICENPGKLKKLISKGLPIEGFLTLPAGQQMVLLEKSDIAALELKKHGELSLDKLIENIQKSPEKIKLR